MLAISVFRPDTMADREATAPGNHCKISTLGVSIAVGALQRIAHLSEDGDRTLPLLPQQRPVVSCRRRIPDEPKGYQTEYGA